MISIKRPAAPAFMKDKKGRWYEETQHAIAYYANGAPGEAFKFKMYNDTLVKNELKKVFVKCAYCESSYGAVYDGDVEHFRPKGRVKEKDPQVPGYYWLANDWDNLFLACQHCNQRRKHILVGATTEEGYGKLDQFPLSREAKRIMKPGQRVSAEDKVRLLLNPCKDKPEDHFAYDKDEAVMIGLTEQAKTSITVYVLQRPLLVQERKKQLYKLLRQIVITKQLLELYNKDRENEAIKLSFDMAMDTLRDFTKSTEVYAGMSRYFVKKFLQENGLA